MVLSMTILRTTYGPKVPDRMRQRFKGHQNECSYIQASMLRLGCSTSDQHIFESENHEEQVPPFACSFSKMANYSHILAVVDEDGFMTLFDTRRSTEVVKVFRAHKNAVFDVAWAEGKNQLVTASGDQMAALWDVTAAKPLGVFKGHSCSLKSVCFRPRDCHVFATGARDGNILVWDTRCNNRGGSLVSHHTPVNIIKEAHAETSNSRSTSSRKRNRLLSSMPRRGDNLSSVTVVNFQDDMSLFSAGATDRTIKVWDLRKCNKGMKKGPTPKQVYPYAGTSIKNGGFSSLIFNSTRSEIFASCTDDIIYRYNTVGTQTQPIANYSGHRNSSFYIKSALSHDNSLLLSGSGNSKAYIWNVNQPQDEPITLCGHDDEVTMVAWATDDFPKLITGADDSSIRIWKLVKDADSRNQSKHERIGYAERSTCTNQLKENLPPLKSSSSATCHSTQYETEKASQVAPTTPAIAKPQTRSPSIKDWLKNSPKAASKLAANTSPTSDSPCTSSIKNLQGSQSKKTLDEKLAAGLNKDHSDPVSIPTCLQSRTPERLRQSVFKITSDRSRTNRQLHVKTTHKDASNIHPINCRQQTHANAITQSEQVSATQPIKSNQGPATKMESQSNQSSVTCRKRKRSSPDMPEEANQSGNSSQDLSRLECSDSPNPVKRNKGLNLEVSKVCERTVKRGRSPLTSHAHHQLCTCSYPSNHRLTANDGTTSECSHSPDAALKSESPKFNRSGITRNISFYFPPHSREAKPSLLDSSKMTNGILATAKGK